MLKIRHGDHVEYVFHCLAWLGPTHACPNVLRLTNCNSDTEASIIAITRHWTRGKGAGKDGDPDPWYCADHFDAAHHKHRWHFLER